MDKNVSIYWIRQDLRLHDNPALKAAVNNGAIVPIYILDDINSGEHKLGSASRIWLHHSLEKLNKQFRNKIGATNILSFQMNENPIEGDLILCHSIIKSEAKEQGKKIIDHYAHLIIHGYLHLLGYDHQNDKDADKMVKGKANNDNLRLFIVSPIH